MFDCPVASVNSVGYGNFIFNLWGVLAPSLPSFHQYENRVRYFLVDVLNIYVMWLLLLPLFPLPP